MSPVRGVAGNNGCGHFSSSTGVPAVEPVRPSAEVSENSVEIHVEDNKHGNFLKSEITKCGELSRFHGRPSVLRVPRYSGIAVNPQTRVSTDEKMPRDISALSEPANSRRNELAD